MGLFKSPKKVLVIANHHSVIDIWRFDHINK
jgi:hypothetical protein